jgi:cysteinyl-tRNA synthetase
MANDVLGETFDVHAGGVDLCFPHHNNEMAQGEAHGQCHEWVKHWWHIGHLHVAGKKVSKSLKNFTTIRDMLTRHSGRVIRLFFLGVPWGATVSYTEEGLTGAETKAREIDAFVASTREAVECQTRTLDQLWTAIDREFSSAIVQARTDVDQALRDNFSYDVAMSVLARLQGDTHKYRVHNPDTYKALLLRQSVDFVVSMLHMLGVETNPVRPDQSTTIDTQLDAIVEFRNQVRLHTSNKAKLLALCDEFRDETMPSLGVRVEDNPGTSSWRRGDIAEMARERQQRIQAQDAARQVKRDDLLAQMARMQLASQSPAAYMASLHDEQDPTLPRFTAFDAVTGMPTHDSHHQPLTKSAIKTIVKAWTKQGKAFANYSPAAAAQLVTRLAALE